MPVPASINDLSTTAGTNSPPGSESPATLDDYARAHASFIAQLRDSVAGLSEAVLRSGGATGAAIIPSGTTAQRPASPVNGYVRYNSDIHDFEYYINGAWVSRTTLTRALNEAPIVTLASASTVNIGAAGANTISISGTIAITAFDTIAAGATRRLVFQGALTLTHNATSLILPGAANITTAAGDVAEFVSLGSGNWRCISYVRDAGIPSTMTQRAAQATTSGTAIDFTGIPSWAKRVTISFDSVSTNGSAHGMVQLGSGSVQTSGYASSGFIAGSNSVTGYSTTIGLLAPYGTSPSNIGAGSMVLTHMGGNKWSAAASGGYINTIFGSAYGGVVTLAGPLDRIKITTANGVDAFDAGSVSIIYEG